MITGESPKRVQRIVDFDTIDRRGGAARDYCGGRAARRRRRHVRVSVMGGALEGDEQSARLDCPRVSADAANAPGAVAKQRAARGLRGLVQSHFASIDGKRSCH